MSADPRPGARFAAAGLLLLLAGCAELGIDAGRLGGLLGVGSSPSQATLIAGLREALQVGTERSVARTSRRGGFLDDPLLRIALPGELDTAAKGLRAIGLGSVALEVEVAMNRAAERATAEATEIFWQAISGMTVQDATGILRGPDDAATVYFRGRTEPELRARFAPVVEQAMGAVGVYRAYDELVARIGVLSTVASPTVELDRYVTDQTLDGLFRVLAGEEKRIREDPAARTTELLRQVFGPA